MDSIRFSYFLRFIPLLVCSIAGCTNDRDVARLAVELQADARDTRYGAAKQIEQRIEDGVDASAAVESLAAALSDDDSQVRYRAAKSLAKLGELAAPAVNELGAALVDMQNDNRTRYYAAKSLYKLGDGRSQAMEELITATKDPDPGVVSYAAKALRRLGGQAEPALPALRRLTKSNHANVRTAAREAIEKIKTDQAN